MLGRLGNTRDVNPTDESMLEGIQALLNNKFSTAQSIFKSHAREYVHVVIVRRPKSDAIF